MPPIPLEDNFNDILGKAIRGRKHDRDALAAQAGLAPASLLRLLDGEFDEPGVRQLAPLLDLGTETLVAIGKEAYHPGIGAPEGLLGFNTPYADFFVNAYLVWDPATRKAVVFDTGSDLTPLLEEAKARGLDIVLILVTHTHQDHIMCLDALIEATGAPAYASELEPAKGAATLTAGQRFQVGGLTIEARKTTGHSRGGTSYVVTGLEKPLVVVGDALFAGSMGGGVVSYEDALANNRREVFTLPDETIICPGHGPLTTIGLEKQHNPFYPEFNPA
ncbi:MBL fold metallo-hydrolase [bacterium]|nr:MBL fold metallo-hydrolase [bacterium]